MSVTYEYNGQPTNSYQSFTFNPAAGTGQVKYLQVGPGIQIVQFVGTLILSDPTNTLVEVTASQPAALAVDPETGLDDGLWTEITSETIIKLDSSLTAVRITNTGTGEIQVDMAF
jgi:hypothetical protein